MKRVIIFILILLTLQNIYAHEETADPGVLPDSVFWGLDKALDSLSLALTFNTDKKTKKGISIAMERISEIKAMLNQNKIEHSLKAKEATSKILLKVKENVAKVEEKDSEKELETALEIENELDEVEDELEELKETEIKIKIKGDLSEEKLQQIKGLISGLLDSSSELEVEIKNKKDKVKLKIKEKGEVDAEELEIELEKKHGLMDKKREKAEEELKDAKEDLADLEALISEGAPKGILQLLNEAKQKITNSENVLAEDKFGEAFGWANAAKNILENAERQLEGEEEKELEIEAEIEEGSTKVKVKIDGEKLKFSIPSTNREEVINQIANELGISVEEIKVLIKFEDEDLEEKLKELKKENIPGEKINFEKVFGEEDLEEELKDAKEDLDKKQEAKTSDKEDLKDKPSNDNSGSSNGKSSGSSKESKKNDDGYGDGKH